MDRTSFDYFMSDVRSLPRQTPEQLVELHISAKAGNSKARHALWLEAVRIVLFAAGKNRMGAETDMDVLQEGMLAAGVAVDSWEPEKGAFSTWVVAKTRGAMSDYYRTELRRGTGSKAAPLPFFESLDESAGVIDAQDTEDAPGVEWVDESPVHDALDLGGFESPEQAAYVEQVRDVVRGIECLELRTIIQSYYGIEQEPMTLQEIANSTGRAVSYIHGKVQQGISLLRTRLSENAGS